MNTPVFDFSNVDWTKFDAVIARELGCTRELVRQKRKKAGLPPSRGWRKSFYEGREIDWSKQDKVIAMECWVSEATVSRTKLELGVREKKPMGRRFNLKDVEIDWNKSYTQLATELGASTMTLSREARRRGITKPDARKTRWERARNEN